MFLRVRMHHSDFHKAISLKSGTNKGLDQALTELLQGCGGVVFNGSPVVKEFIWKLQKLLLKMCNFAKKSQQDTASSSSASKANDLNLLKEMCNRALKVTCKPVGNDFSSLYRMWHTDHDATINSLAYSVEKLQC